MKKAHETPPAFLKRGAGSLLLDAPPSGTDASASLLVEIATSPDPAVGESTLPPWGAIVRPLDDPSPVPEKRAFRLRRANGVGQMVRQGIVTLAPLALLLGMVGVAQLAAYQRTEAAPPCDRDGCGCR